MNMPTFRPTLFADYPSEVAPVGILRDASAGKSSHLGVQPWRHRGPLLQRNPFGNNPGVKALPFVSGSLAEGLDAFLPTERENASSGVRLVANAAEVLRQELAQTLDPPQAVYLCPHADPFPPIASVQEETMRVIEVLARHGIDAWIMTRGCIRPSAMDVLARYRGRIKLMMGMTTLDRQLQRTLEPLTCPPRLRLRQLRRLRSLDIPVQVALEPLVPGVTDTRENLLAVLEKLAGAGVRRVIAGYLFLPPGGTAKVERLLGPLGRAPLVLDAFADGFDRHVGGCGQVRYLSRSRRHQGYSLLMSLAARFGITVSISSASNPDLARPAHNKPASQPYLPGLELADSAAVR